MKKFLALIILVLLCSCNILLVSPQPSWIKKNEKKIPKKFRGTYLVKGTCLGDSKNDTLRIGEKRIFDTYDTDLTLSDSVLLKIYRHQYFLNVYTNDEKAWFIVMAKKEKQKNLCLFYLDERDSTLLKRLKKITEVNTKVPGEANTHFISPSTKEFRKILKQDLFTVCDTLIRIK